jgi:hypothetical protein
MYISVNMYFFGCRYKKEKENLTKNIPLGSGIRKKFIPDPGGKQAPDPGSGTLPQSIPSN